MATDTTREEGDEVDATHDFSATAAEPAFENQEAPAAYAVHPPTIKQPEATANSGMSSSDITQSPDAPILPPRPPDDHLATAHEPETATQPMNRGTQGGEDAHREDAVDPAIAPLKAMFPDFDEAVLYVCNIAGRIA